MIRRTLTLPVIAAMVLIAACLMAILALGLWTSRPEEVARPPATAVITRIPAPTASSPATTPTPAESPTPTAASTTTPPPGTIAIGTFVQITGTGGDGLRLRTGPGLDEEVRFLGLEAEVFEVRDGPNQANDFTWWYLVAPFDETRNGWAVAPYLVVIQN